MSERLIAAAATNKTNIDRGEMESPVPRVVLVREAVALLGWGTMTYACDRCGFEWKVWLGFGVEGPEALREHGLYVPSPFTAGTCPSWPIKPDATTDDRKLFQHLTKCDGRMGHVRWGEDETFGPLLIPDDAPRFVLDTWYEAAQLVIPEPALIYARRFHSDREGGES